jgi:hypothetical protein
MVDWTARGALIDPKMITHRICLNPNYGGISTGVPGTVGVKIRNKVKPETRERIRLSIEREGVRNPIIVYNTTQGMFLGFGGGRLQACAALDKPVPAIVIDYVGDMVDHPEVTPSNWQDFFTDVPDYFEWTDFGIYTHYGLERSREEDVDTKGIAWASADDMPAIINESPWLDDDV